MAASVSVIVPTFNRARWLGNAIRSALQQLQAGDELIVIDDGSTDDTREVVAAFGERVTYVRGEHRGAGPARNLGLARARGDLVAFLDDDDEWLPGKLARQRAFLDAHPDVLFCFSDFQVVTGDGEVQHRFLRHWRHDARSFRDMFGPPERIAGCDVYVGDLYVWQLTGLYVLANTLVVRRAAAGDALHFAEDLQTYEDVECFIRLSRQGKAAYFDLETAQQTDRAAGRLSQLSLITKLRCHLAILERQYGRDAEFLATHRLVYERTIRQMQAQLLRLQILRGDLAGARHTLAALPHAPLHLWLVLHLPDPWIGRALEGYRRVHTTAGRWLQEPSGSRARHAPSHSPP
ncbi:MAG TPA: glycosyltransferase family 2 protein [Kofleriaceae bacterium]